MGKSFNIIICGGGIGGLGAAIALRRKGHNVTVLESAPALNEVGAGIQIPPNSTKILAEYGLKQKFLERVTIPSNIIFRRYETGNAIGITPLRPDMEQKYGHEYWLIYRPDYQDILFKAAKEIGVDIRLNTFVESVDETGPSVRIVGGQVLRADLIIGADGIRSKTRDSIMSNIEPETSRNCAYRATVPADVMNSDPMIAHLMTDINANCWIGHERHIMAYPMRNGTLYNLVMSHPGAAAVGRWNEPGNLDEMKGHYNNFDPIIRRVLEHVKTVLKWKLAYMPNLQRWVSDNGKVVLLGDAAHGMLPYLAQGAATSIEDGAALAECLDRAQSIADIPHLMRAFETCRKSRCETISAGATANGDIWHYPDGPQQQQRDREMQNKVDTEEESVVENPNKWSDKNFQPWLFGHDVFAVTNSFLDQYLAQNSKSAHEKFGYGGEEMVNGKL